MAFADPADTQDPTTGAAITAAWGDAVNAGIQWLAGDPTNPKPSCKVYHNADQSIADSSLTTIAFNAEYFDYGGMHSTVTNNSRITIPAGAGGIYLIGYTFEWSTDSSSGIRQSQLFVNGSSTIGLERNDGTVPYNNFTVLTGLSAGDYVEVAAYQNSGGALNVLNAPSYSAIFWAMWMNV